MPLKKQLNPNNLTSHASTVEKIRNDPHFRGDVYAKTLIEPVLAGYRAMSDGWKDWPPQVPMLITHGQDDPSTSPSASKQFIERIRAKDKEFRDWPGMLHEGHNERAELRDPFLEYS